MRHRLLVLPALLLAGCGSTSADADTEGPEVVATTSVIADLVTEVAGEQAEVSSLVAVGVDPHVYEPTPADARLLAGADLVVANGLGLEGWLAQLLDDTTDERLVELTEGLGVRFTGDDGEPDPHLWMDPTLVTAYVDNARQALTDLDPASGETYAANADVYLDALEDLDTWVAEEVATIPAAQRKLVTTHDAFRYFGDRYGLEVLGTIWSVSTEREPSAEEIRALVDAVRQQPVGAVFVESTVDDRVMRRVARDAGVQIGEELLGDSLGATAETGTYLGMIRHNTRAIVDGLGGGS